MAHLVLDQALLSSLNDKVVVITGGATGIGRSAVTLFHRKLPSRLYQTKRLTYGSAREWREGCFR